MCDSDVMRRIADGDKEAFKELVNRYKDQVFRLCIKFTGNKEDSEDLTQEIFFLVYKNAHTFKFKSSVFTWLYRIVLNTSRNFERKKRWNKYFGAVEFNELNIDRTAYANSERETPDEKYQRTEKIILIDKAINTLPFNQKTAFVLHHVEGLSYDKIADVMNCSISAVESRIHRAKINLQKKLIKYLQKNM